MKRNVFYDIVFSAAISAVMMMGLLNGFVLRMDPLVMAVTIGAAISAQYVLFLWKRLNYVLLAIIAAAALFIWITGMWRGIETAILDYMFWLQGNYGFNEGGAFENLTVVLLTVLVTVPVTSLIHYRAPSVFILISGTAIFFCLQWVDLSYPAWQLFAFLLLWLCQTVSQSKAGTYGKHALPLALPVCALMVWGVSTIPAGNEPLGTPVVRWVNENLGGFFKGMGVVESRYALFSFESVAKGMDMSDIDQELGGKLNSSDNTFLYISGDKPMYIKGRTARTYDGRRWLSEEPEVWRDFMGSATIPTYPYIAESVIADSSMMDPWQTPVFLALWGNNWEEYFNVLNGPFFAVKGIDLESSLFEDFSVTFAMDLNALFSKTPGLSTLMGIHVAMDGFEENREWFYLKSTKVEYWDIATKTLFIPDRTVAITFDRDLRPVPELLVSSPGDIRAKDMLKKNFRYNAQTLQYTLTREEWESFYREIESRYFEFVDMASGAGSVRLSGRLLSMMLRFEDQRMDAHANYTSVPESITARTKQLARDLTEGKIFTYDAAKAIETYLAGNFKYNVDMESTPEGEDFVDYFLFEQKQGYCSYFATAMTMLCRSAGIPARYVEGFRPNYDKRGTFYYVTGRQAHAWVEVYIQGVGWLPFEPTAAFHADFVQNQLQGGVVTPNPSGGSVDLSPTPRPTVTPRDIEQPDLSGVNNAEKKQFQWKTLFWVLPIVLPALWITLQNRRYSRFRRMVRGQWDDAGTLRNIYAHFERAFGLMKARRLPHETPIEYGRRVGTEFALLGDTMLACSEIYCIVCYGEERISAGDREKYQLLYYNLEKLYDYRMGKPKKLFYRYILGWI